MIYDNQYHDVLAIIKGFRNGLVYGAKIRFPHAMVMTFLFRSGSYYLSNFKDYRRKYIGF